MNIKTAIITMIILSTLFLIAGADLGSKLADRRAEFQESISRMDELERIGKYW